MAQYDELTRLLRELLTNRFSPKPRYVRGVLGDGLGNVVVPDRPDKSYARFSKNSTTYFEIFNRTVNPVNNWPILIGELPWQPGLTQVVDTDWSAFEQAGWGDTLGNTSPHAPTHEWPDGSPGSDAVDVHLRAIVPGRAFISDTAPTVIYVNSFEYGTTGTLWAGLPGVDLQPMMSATVTGTMRYAGVYVDESTNSLGIVTGGTTVYTSALEPPRVSFPETGVIPIARVRVYGGQTGLVEADIKDARRLFDTGGGDPNAIPQSLLNAKGDLITATAADTPTILTVGTDGYVLTADSGEATGIKWAAAGGWPFDALKVISPTNASADTTTVQGAFDTGDALDIFLVDPGLYTENVTANKLISIIGDNAARCVLRGTTSNTPVINATAAALFKELTVTNEAGGTTAACVNVSTSLVSPQFYNLRVSKSLGGGTTGVGFDISAGTGIWIENCRIKISNGTNRYGIRVTGTATFTVTVVGGSISATTADVLVNNSNATVRLWGPVLTGGGLSVSAGTVTGWWYDSSGGLHIIGGGWPYNDVHNVGGNARLATVEAALNDAAVGAGDVVELGQDSTEDAVALDKTVTVQGKSREFALTVDNSANGLNISANGARAERLNVINTTTAATTYGVYCNATGIVLERVSALVAAGGTTRYGIAVPSSMSVTLRECTAQGTGGGGTNIGLVVDGTAYVYGGEFSGDDYSLAIGAAGTVSLYGPRLNGAIYNTGTISADSWWYDASGDVHLAASTNGLNTRFERLFGDDVPAATYKFTQRTFLVDSGADQLGFETSQANPYSLAGTNFTLSAPASNYNFRSNFSTHWLLFTCTDATTPLYLTWSGTAKNYYRGLVWFGSPPAVSDQYLFELRLWDTTTPGAGSAYYGWRIDWLGSTYPQYPLRFQGVRGTGVTFPDGGRTNLGASAPLPVHPFFFVTRLLATNAFYVSLAEAESPYPFYELNNSTGSISQFRSARFHAPAFSGANGYGLCMFDQIQVT